MKASSVFRICDGFIGIKLEWQINELIDLNEDTILSVAKDLIHDELNYPTRFFATLRMTILHQPLQFTISLSSSNSEDLDTMV